MSAISSSYVLLGGRQGVDYIIEYPFSVVYRGDRRGQNIESTNVRPSRHPHHRHYPLPLPPMSDVVTNSMRKRNRYSRKKQPVCKNLLTFTQILRSSYATL